MIEDLDWNSRVPLYHRPRRNIPAADYRTYRYYGSLPNLTVIERHEGTDEGFLPDYEGACLHVSKHIRRCVMRLTDQIDAPSNVSFARDLKHTGGAGVYPTVPFLEVATGQFAERLLTEIT